MQRMRTFLPDDILSLSSFSHRSTHPGNLVNDCNNKLKFFSEGRLGYIIALQIFILCQVLSYSNNRLLALLLQLWGRHFPVA